ncbi:MAG: ferredoxin family protein [Promethearchaeota archaeon]
MPEWKNDNITITIDHDACTGCGECVSNCPADVFELKNEKSVVVNLDDCAECCVCVDNCPENAITHTSCS